MIIYLIGLVIGGLVVGALGRLLHPGRDAMSLPMTMLLGIASMLIAGLIVRPLLGFGGGFITAVVIAVILLALYGRFAKPGGRPATS